MQRHTETTGQQIAALAHDLRTPMCVAACAAQMALEAGGKDVSAQLRQILQAVRTMDRMLSTMSDEQETGTNTTFTAEMLRAELLTMTTDEARMKEQTLRIDLTEMGNGPYFADYASLSRVLINLLSNAIKYTPRGGQISLQASVEKQDGLQARFVVCDSGMGMKPEFMTRLFLPFERAAESAHLPGKGLGLAIVKRLVERMHGTIAVRSEWGEGTIFDVCIPLRAQQAMN